MRTCEFEMFGTLVRGGRVRDARRDSKPLCTVRYTQGIASAIRPATRGFQLDNLLGLGDVLGIVGDEHRLLGAVRGGNGTSP